MTDNTSSVVELPNRTWLIQRLKQPFDNPNDKWSKLDRIFSFGGGGSGFNDQAWDILAKLFRFDYMGAAEFEFGKPIQVFADIMKRIKYFVSDELILGNKDFKFPYGYDKSKLVSGDKKTVYIFADKRQMLGVKEVIKNLAKDSIQLKESSHFRYSYFPSSDLDRKTVGWIEYNNGFLFFKDKEMYERTVSTFKGIK